jgi:hypothetical protein
VIRREYKDGKKYKEMGRVQQGNGFPLCGKLSIIKE